jgi:hypothetical protein
MPRVIVPLNNTDNTVTRLIIKSAMEQLLYHLNITTMEDIIYIPRASKQNAQPQQHRPNEPIRLDTEELIKVEYEELFDVDNRDITKYQMEYPAIFNEPKLGIKVYPTYARSKITLTVTFASKSYDRALQWLINFRRALQLSVATATLNLEYTYTIPDEILAYIVQAHTLSENVAGYGTDLKTFVNTNFCERGLEIRSNGVGKSKLIMAIKNTGVAGIYDEIPEKIEQQKEPPLTNFTFSYYFFYDRADGLILEYQHYIHNQLMDLSIIHPFGDRRYHGNPIEGHMSFSHSIIMATDSPTAPMHYIGNGSHITDGWVPKLTPGDYKVNLLLPIILNPLNLKEIINLNDLIPYGFTPELISQMILLRDKLNKQGKTFVLFEVFEVDDKETRVSFTVDAAGNIITDYDGSLRCRHYLRVLISLNLSGIDWAPFMRSPDNLLVWINWTYPQVPLTLFDIGEDDDGEVIRNVTPNKIVTLRNLIENTSYLPVGNRETATANLVSNLPKLG